MGAKHIERVCAYPGCKAKFRSMAGSEQLGCCRNHDPRGIAHWQQLTLRRSKGKPKKKVEVDLVTGAELEDIEI